MAESVEEATLPGPSRSPTPGPDTATGVGRPKKSAVWQYFVYSEVTGKSTCLVGGAGDRESVCGYEVAGKFPTNLKQHLKKHHLLQYQDV